MSKNRTSPRLAAASITTLIAAATMSAAGLLATATAHASPDAPDRACSFAGKTLTVNRADGQMVTSDTDGTNVGPLATLFNHQDGPFTDFDKTAGTASGSLTGKDVNFVWTAKYGGASEKYHGTVQADGSIQGFVFYSGGDGGDWTSPKGTVTCTDAQAPAAQGQHLVEQHIVAYCTAGGGQDCDQKPSVHFEATAGQQVQIRYTPDASGCSDAVFDFYLDGATAGNPTVGKPGQQISGVPYTVAEGGHDASISAKGIEGGCNTGTLMSWGGTLVVDVIDGSDTGS